MRGLGGRPSHRLSAKGPCPAAVRPADGGSDDELAPAVRAPLTWDEVERARSALGISSVPAVRRERFRWAAAPAAVDSVLTDVGPGAPLRPALATTLWR